METIQAYRIIEKIGETRGAQVFRAKKEGDAPTVIIKLLKAEYPRPATIAGFKSEYEIIKNIHIDGVIKTIDLLEVSGRFVLVLEDFNGITLNDFCGKQPLSIKEFLQIAVVLSETLGNLHKENIVHMDIKPQNILINQENKKVKITDFGISATMTNENKEMYNPEVIKGTLSYMSPEQTGRMNRTVDYRTDLYSLGITFYEMLTGRPPFISDDPMEIIHAHFAKNPIPPSEARPDIPAPVSDIIMKLMSKTPEERYQNSFGLLADMKECLSRLDSTGKIAPFELAGKDISLKFNLPQKLYGREKEIDHLISAFERIGSGKIEMQLVSGLPGAGKTALINSIQKSVVERRGFFIDGKYEQFRRDVPYSAIIQAFKKLIKHLLGLNREMIDIWKERILEAISPNAKIITESVPELEHIIGPQPDLPPLGPKELQNLLNLVTINFLKVFATKEHPLVLFLDDLHWVDSASLEYLKRLMTDPELGYILVIGSFRDNEMDEAHPALLTFDEIEKKGGTVQTLSVKPIGVDHINVLIFEFLKCTQDRSFPLAKLIHGKTGGNPFFINHFLKILYESNLLYLDHSEWLWDLNQIQAMQLTDNVVDLLAEKIIELKKNIRDLLKVCACIGNKFDLELLSVVMDIPIETVVSHIKDAINEGYLGLAEQEYRFNHDRIREAAYSLLSEQERSETHTRIGRLFLERTDKADLPKHIFYIVSQLNHGIKNLTLQDECDELAWLNYVAGRRAIVSAAYSPALTFLETGISLLRTDCWESQYKLTFNLHRNAAEAAFLNGDFEKVRQFSEYAVSRTGEIRDVAKIRKIEILSYCSQNNLQEAISLGLRLLEDFGISFPKKTNKLHVIWVIIKLKRVLKEKHIETFIDLPQMTDKNMLTAMDIITAISTPAFMTKPELFVLLVYKRYTLSMEYGNSPASATAYSALGIIFCSILEDFDTGYAFGKLALDLINKLGDKSFKTRVQFTVSHFITHWKYPVKEMLPPLIEGYKTGLETGQLEFGALCALSSTAILPWFCDINLIEIRRNMEKYVRSLRRINQITVSQYIEIGWQAILNLIEERDDPCQFKGSAYDEEKMLPIHLEAKDRSGLSYFYNMKTIISYVYENYAKAGQYIEQMETYVSAQKATIAIPEFFFWNSLIKLALWDDIPKSKRKKQLKTVIACQKKLKKFADACPAHSLSRFCLVEAEKARVLNDSQSATDYYEKAITNARDTGNSFIEALANEMAAKFYHKRSQIKFAGMYMREAHYVYEKWGASAKVKHLEKTYPELFSFTYAGISKSLHDTGSLTLTTHTGSGTDSLDFSTVMKASQTISGEIVLGRLLKKMMWIIIESAGAEKGAIIFEKHGEFFVEAEGKMEIKDIDVMKSIPINDHGGVSASIISYVSRIQDTLILNNASVEGDFVNTPYIVKHQPKSVLCMPILAQGKLTGILYLENNLSAGAFTPKRLEILKVLSSQIAISIENARLYANLEQKVEERTADLKAARDALWGEMELAKKIQTVLLPEDPRIDGYDIAAYMEPADEVGGDYYDVINVEGRDWVVIGDVSGHGVTAGLVMMMAQTSINTAVSKNPDLHPSELLLTVNRIISRNIRKLGENKYMTITALACLENGEFYFSGLHQDIMIYRAASKEVEQVETEGMWLGLVDDAEGLFTDNTLMLNVGDTMLMFTDGVTEAVKHDSIGQHDGGAFFDTNNLTYILKEFGHDSAEEVKNRILAALKDYTRDDDVTLVVLKRQK